MPLNRSEIPFGPWLPDQPDYSNPGCIEAKNCYPSAGGYSPFPGTQETSFKLTGQAVQGAVQVYRSGGVPVLLFGGSTKLAVWPTNAGVAESTGYTAIGGDAAWDFALFNSRAIAVGPNNSPQQLTDINSDTSWSALTGSPPEARVVGRVGDFLVLGNLSGLSLPYTIQWSAQNDPTDWPTPATNDARLKSSGRAVLQSEYGAITGIAGDRYPMIFQERGIFRIEPVGPPVVFNVRQPVSEARGALAPQSIVTVGFLTFFLSADGFFVTDGNQETPIGTSRIHEWFFDNVRVEKIALTHGAVNWKEQCVVWSFYKGVDATGFNAQIIYSWAENRWSRAELDVDWIVDSKIEDPATAADIEILSAFIDDGTDSVVNYLNGPNLACVLETGAHQPMPGQRISVNAMYPRVEAITPGALALEDETGVLLLETGDDLLLEQGAIQGTLISQDTLGDAASETEDGPTARGPHDFVPVRGDGFFARARLTLPAGTSWDKAQGFAIEFRPSGRR